MAKQNDDEKLRAVAPSPELERDEARTLEDAVDSHGTLEGFYAMNNIRDDEEREALELEKKKRPSLEKP